MTTINQGGGGGGHDPLLWDWHFTWDWNWLVPPRDHSRSNDGVQVIPRGHHDADGS
jgi:hypothetical protein